MARVKVRPKTLLPHVLVHLGMSQHPEVLRLRGLGSQVRLRDAARIVYHADLGTQYHTRARAAKTLKQPHHRNNPDDAKRVRQHINSQNSDADRLGALLHVLMKEDFSKRCRQGAIYSVRGALPPSRSLRDALLPPAASTTDVVQPLFACPDPTPSDQAADWVLPNYEMIPAAAEGRNVFLQAGIVLLCFSM